MVAVTGAHWCNELYYVHDCRVATGCMKQCLVLTWRQTSTKSSSSVATLHVNLNKCCQTSTWDSRHAITDTYSIRCSRNWTFHKVSYICVFYRLRTWPMSWTNHDDDNYFKTTSFVTSKTSNAKSSQKKVCFSFFAKISNIQKSCKWWQITSSQV